MQHNVFYIQVKTISPYLHSLIIDPGVIIIVFFLGYSGAIREDLYSDSFNTQHNTGLSNAFADDHYSTYAPTLNENQTGYN